MIPYSDFTLQQQLSFTKIVLAVLPHVGGDTDKAIEAAKKILEAERGAEIPRS